MTAYSTDTPTTWSLEELKALHDQPLMELLFRAASVHREFHDPNEVQVSSLVSIKTGGCPEDCGYCPQAARYHTDIEENALLSVEQVKTAAERAKGLGSSRLCMGAAWRNVRDDAEFEQVLELVRTVNGLDMEVCATLGMLTPNQAERLAAAGLYAYNHNLDSSEDFYKEVISTRGYEDRLETIGNARKAGLTVCSGGIIGMGESVEDRLKMLLTLGSLRPVPESVPINALVAVPGTPLEDQRPVDIFEMVRMIAVTRIVLPTTTVRLSAGRTDMTPEGQALCFFAGAGSIFAGDKLLTTPNPEAFADMELFDALGLRPTQAYAKGERPVPTADPGPPEQKRPIRWSRPGHKIERNEAKRK
ncbi:biotin synthase BioB [Neolewinella litorea]|uniref:Biotin synthase n=2 Tax=Neolewinella litorea TaxID=2562452 RepID=A0A4S4NYH3_9BACT|nr:biotin synthase BioB [Neolewinella litorea]THH41310.1 biotin synthase BioB [Neolewinella litorea]